MPHPCVNPFCVLTLALAATSCGFQGLQTTQGNTAAEHAEVAEIPTRKIFSKQSPKHRDAPKDPCVIYGDDLSAFELPQTAEIWQRIRSGFAFPDAPSNDQIAKQVITFTKHPNHLIAVTERGKLYLHYILDKLDERNLPHELALIPMVESGFDPFAYSYATASGLWQFMPYTGKHLGLEQNWWYDGRRDVPASTEAALTYLSNLYKMFDEDWLLALAAYNGGQGNVRKAISRNQKKGKSTDFWALDLPPQTELYIPKVLALKEIILRPDIYDIALPPIADAPYFALADVEGQLDLAQAAKLADVEIDEIYQLNPGFNRWATSPDGPHCLVVPATKYDGFLTALRALPLEERVTWERYVIKKGDALGAIATQHRTTPELLKQINNLKTDTIVAGKTLLIPRSSEAKNFYVLSSVERRKAKQASGQGIRTEYIVRNGDSLSSIARQNKTSASQIAAWNNMALRDTLHIGQKLVLWDSSGSDRDKTRKIKYKVKKGDSLARIADKFGVTILKLENWNGINRQDILRPGKTLTVHVNVIETSS
jgi:membrane-bound lytic murein transglycosylase D